VNFVRKLQNLHVMRGLRGELTSLEPQYPPTVTPCNTAAYRCPDRTWHSYNLVVVPQECVTYHAATSALYPTLTYPIVFFVSMHCWSCHEAQAKNLHLRRQGGIFNWWVWSRSGQCFEFPFGTWLQFHTCRYFQCIYKFTVALIMDSQYYYVRGSLSISRSCN
jgi:hypothetical protein